MKRYVWANRVLVASLAALLAVMALTLWSPWKGERWLSILYFLAQSCFIGCAADFIAVEALFRRRLHLPYRPLIPANRDRIIEKVKDVNDSLLSRESLLARVKSFSATDLALRYLSAKQGEKRAAMERVLAEKAAALFVDFLEAHKEEAGQRARKEANAWLATLKSFAREKLLTEMQRDAWLDRLLTAGMEKLQDPKTRRLLISYLEKKGDREKKGFLGGLGYFLGKQFGAINYEDLTDSFLHAILTEMKAWQKKDHPFRRRLLARWDRFVRAFLDDPETEAALAGFVSSLLAAVPIEERVEGAISSFLTEWAGEHFHDRLVPKVESAIHQSLSGMEGNETLKVRVDDFARGLLSDMISYEHSFLSAAVLDVLSSMGDRELNEFVESKVHHELEGIRLNGAAVGLLSGAAFYLFLLLCWNPLLRNLGG